MESDLHYLTPREYAAIMRVGLGTVRKLINAKELPAVRVGNQFRIPRSAVEIAEPVKTSERESA
ncbi:MAG: excisionase family DNA-binding protein [Cryobacterium sp.]|nr:excisionase family DNA-binding protein [Cryobacterium sp.]